MPITRTPIIDDDGTGTTGTVIDNAWKTELYNQIDGLGTWIDVPFNLANFWSDMTAGMVLCNRYMIIGKTMWWTVQVANATVPNPLTPYLPFTIPGGGYIAKCFSPVAYAFDVTAVPCQLFALSGSQIAATKWAGGNWSTYPITVSFTAVISLV